jgi:hypothetical protein
VAWRARAACRVRDPSRFVREGPPDVLALLVCRSCPVRIDCARYAVDLIDRGWRLVGTWGGVHIEQIGRGREATERLREVAR